MGYAKTGAIMTKKAIPGHDNNMTLLPCPFCGLVPDMDDESTLHPVTREKDLWTFNCLEERGGCTASVLGRTPSEAIAAWERRTESK